MDNNAIIESIMEDFLPKFDIPGNFIVGDFITKEILDFYKAFPCKIKSGIFVLVTGGRLKATINLTDYEIKPNDFVTVSPGSFIQIHEIEGDIKLHFAAFSSTFLNQANYIKSSLDFLPLIIETPLIPLSDESAGILKDFISLLMRADNAEDKILNEDSYRSLLKFFLNEVTRLYNSNFIKNPREMTRENAILKEFIQLALLNYMKEHTVSFYADKLGITLQHFCNTIKKVTGRTALDILSTMIIMDAKAHLKTTDVTIKEIALSLGFTNQAFFNKYFKQHVGMTPQEYRKN